MTSMQPNEFKFLLETLGIPVPPPVEKTAAKDDKPLRPEVVKEIEGLV